MRDGEAEFFAQQFQTHRAHLRQVAYRMLGSLSEADDAVQEAWLRLSRSDPAAVDNLGGWLTTVVGRISLDMLRVRRNRAEVQTGSWLPEPIAAAEGAETDPETQAMMADSVGLALLVVLSSSSRRTPRLRAARHVRRPEFFSVRRGEEPVITVTDAVGTEYFESGGRGGGVQVSHASLGFAPAPPATARVLRITADGTTVELPLRG